MLLSRILLAVILSTVVSQLHAAIRVEIKGISGALLQNAKLFMEIEAKKSLPDLQESTVEQLHNEAPNQIQAALRPFGYYKVKVASKLKRGEEVAWIAQYQVDTGPPTMIDTLDLRIVGEGTQDAELMQTINKFPLKEGGVINHDAYEAGKQNIQRVAYLNGYFDSRFTRHELRVNPETSKARVFLYFDSGPRYHFGRVRFRQEAYAENYLQRFLPFQSGEMFAEEKLAELQFRLQDSNNFQNITIERRRDLSDNHDIPLDLILVPKKKHYYQIGLGYGTDTEARTSFLWQNRRVNMLGHRIGAGIKYSAIGREISASYSIPLHKPNTDKLEFISSLAKETIQGKESSKREIIVRRTFARWWKWSEILSIRYLTGPYKDSSIDNDPPATSMLIPGASWTKLSVNDPIFPRRGYRLSFSVEGSDDQFMRTDTSFLSLKSQGKIMRSLGDNVFIARAQLGTLSTPSLDKLHTDLRFFTGGDNSVRGFDYKGIDGLENLHSSDLTSQKLKVISGEYQYWLLRNWGLSMFADAGNVVQHWNDPVKKAAGFGVLWRSPVGPFSLSFARDLHIPNHTQAHRNKWRLHLSIGPNL